MKKIDELYFKAISGGNDDYHINQATDWERATRRI